MGKGWSHVKSVQTAEEHHHEGMECAKIDLYSSKPANPAENVMFVISPQLLHILTDLLSQVSAFKPK